MEPPNPLFAFVSGLLLCVFGTASALPPNADPRLLSLVPPGAAIVAGLTPGTPAYLVLTRNNTMDLADFLSISGVDSTRKIWHMTFVAAAGDDGFISEHSLLASGQFNSSHIFKSAKENGATESKYLGVSVLIIAPLDRTKVSRGTFAGLHSLIPHKVIRLSQKQYDEFVAQEEIRGLCQRRTGVECRQGSK